MSTPIVTDPTASTQPITPIPGHEYEIAGDGADWFDGRLLRGILVAADGRAYAGRIEHAADGEFVSIALTEAGMYPAPAHWEYYVLRELPGLPPPPAAAGASPGPAPCAIFVLAYAAAHTTGKAA